jgi:hypothetical protein
MVGRLYSSLTDDQLLMMFSGLHNTIVNQEWYSRYGINCPYRLDKFGRILNCMSKQIVPDLECDRLIVRQANDVRTLNQLY